MKKEVSNLVAVHIVSAIINCFCAFLICVGPAMAAFIAASLVDKEWLIGGKKLKKAVFYGLGINTHFRNPMVSIGTWLPHDFD